MLILTMPPCPSTNQLYVARRDGKGRAKTIRYRDWIRHAGYEALTLLRTQGGGISGPVRVDIEVPFNRQRDIDNIKPLLDLLTTVRAIDDDRWVDELVVRRNTARKDCLIRISSPSSSPSQ